MDADGEPSSSDRTPCGLGFKMKMLHPIGIVSIFGVLLVGCFGCATRGLSDAEHLARGKHLFAGKEYAGALVDFGKVIERESVTEELHAEALYWTAETYAAHGDLPHAYQTARRLIWDHPTTKWAGRYRGKLPIWPEGETQPTDRK